MVGTQRNLQDRYLRWSIIISMVLILSTPIYSKYNYTRQEQPPKSRTPNFSAKKDASYITHRRNIQSPQKMSLKNKAKRQINENGTAKAEVKSGGVVEKS
jgi:hypothetical protein